MHGVLESNNNKALYPGYLYPPPTIRQTCKAWVLTCPATSLSIWLLTTYHLYGSQIQDQSGQLSRNFTTPSGTLLSDP